MTTKLRRHATVAITLAALWTGTPATAAPLPFTWNPAGASPALGGSAFTADTIFSRSFLTDVGQPDGTGVAHQISVVTGFALGGNPVSPPGFGTSYGLYFDITDTHTSGPPPEILRFSSYDVTLRADPGNRNGAALATTGGVGFANTGSTGQADDITLATGSRVSSLAILNVLTGVLDGRFDTTFLPAAGESGFFASPRLDGSVLLDGFSSNPANFVMTPQPDGTSITVFNDFATTSQLVPVPEPASILLLGTGALALVRRRRRVTSTA